MELNGSFEVSMSIFSGAVVSHSVRDKDSGVES